ncbi:MAG: helix-turn-helix domain-containing protein [Allorhizobium sp.]
MAIDSEWFYRELEHKGASARELAAFLGLDPSSISRMLKGDRKMSAEEQDAISVFLGVPLETVAMHRRGDSVFTGVEAQKPCDPYPGSPPGWTPTGKMFGQDDIIYKDGKRWMEKDDGTLTELHPIFGCMAGTITIMPGVDLTAPMDWDVEWGEKLYNA